MKNLVQHEVPKAIVRKVDKQMDREMFLKFLAKLEKRYENGLDTAGYSPRDYMWLGYCLAMEE